MIFKNFKIFSLLILLVTCQLSYSQSVDTSTANALTQISKISNQGLTKNAQAGANVPIEFASFKIVMLLPNPNSLEFRVYGALNSKSFCKNGPGGTGQQPWAYVDLSDPYAKYFVASLMQTYQENRGITLGIKSLSDSSGSTRCRIDHFAYY
jgi:hypothetical protein